MDNNYRALINRESKKLPILLKSIVVGLLAGMIVAAYRFSLIKAESFSLQVSDFVSSHVAFLPIALLLLGAAGYVTGMLISKFR
ncbi:hypothetical protein ABNN70_00010 [Sporolactobacillus sp. Y61]|uniref:Chloride channel protein n=1 Tax=Sporolactobacillus sp. Y61 TaxID=3160863 RepID=A0AAU8IFI9_9BACL